MQEYTFQIKNNSGLPKTLALLTGNFDTLNINTNRAKGTVTETTNADGEVTIPHGLYDKEGNGVKPDASFVNIQGDSVNIAKVIDADTTNLTVLVIDAAGADVASTSVTLEYVAFADSMEKMYNDAQALKDAGVKADLAVDDGVIYKDATGNLEVIPADSDQPYRRFLREIQQGQQSLVGIRIQANDENAFDEYFTLEKVAILSDNNMKKKILLRNNIDPDQFAQKTAIVKNAMLDDYPVNSETVATLPVKTGMELTVTYVFA